MELQLNSPCELLKLQVSSPPQCVCSLYLLAFIRELTVIFYV